MAKQAGVKTKSPVWPYKNVALPPEVYERLGELADANHRTRPGQIAALVEMAEQKAETKPAPPKRAKDDKPPAA